MPDRFEELLPQLERLTASILKESAAPDNYDPEHLNASLEQRSALVRQLSDCVTSSPPVSYTEYNRLVIVHFQGGQIEANLRNMRRGIATELSCGARDRRYADRIAGQFPPTP